jgi:hypothetical protein
MRVRGVIGCLVVLLAAGLGSPATAQKKKGKEKDKDVNPVNEQVLAFCKEHLGEQVGNGECWTLAHEAVRSAGAKSSPAYKDSPNKGDYVWGDLVYGVEVKDGKPVQTGAAGKVRPGDVAQLRDAKFSGRRPGGGTYTQSTPHHTAVVAAVGGGGTVLGVLHQNWGGKKTVHELTFNLNDLKAGWVKVYRPQK